jgi:GDPmannose 4,6-dehydratase
VDPTKAMSRLGWKPKYDLASLVKGMIESDIILFNKDSLLRENGFQISNPIG